MKIVRTGKRIITNSIQRAITAVLIKVILATGVVSLIASYAFGQGPNLGTVLKYEKLLFDKYNIHYAGGWSRYLCESGVVNTLDPTTRASVKKEVSAFQKWNTGYFQNVPSKSPLFDMEFYLTGKVIESDFVNFVMRTSNTKIVGVYEKQVNDSSFNIQTIIILETYSATASPEFDSINHMILIKQFNGVYRFLSPNDEYINFSTLDCLDCYATY